MVPVAWGVAGTFETLFHAVSVGVQNRFVKMVALDCGVFSLRISGAMLRCWPPLMYSDGRTPCQRVIRLHKLATSFFYSMKGGQELLFEYTVYILWSRPFCLPDDPGSSPKLFACRNVSRLFGPRSLWDIGQIFFQMILDDLMILNHVTSLTTDFPRFDRCFEDQGMIRFQQIAHCTARTSAPVIGLRHWLLRTRREAHIMQKAWWKGMVLRQKSEKNDQDVFLQHHWNGSRMTL